MSEKEFRSVVPVHLCRHCGFPNPNPWGNATVRDSMSVSFCRRCGEQMITTSDQTRMPDGSLKYEKQNQGDTVVPTFALLRVRARARKFLEEVAATASDHSGSDFWRAIERNKNDPSAPDEVKTACWWALQLKNIKGSGPLFLLLIVLILRWWLEQKDPPTVTNLNNTYNVQVSMPPPASYRDQRKQIGHLLDKLREMFTKK